MAVIGNFNRLCQNPMRHLVAPSKENEMLSQGAQLYCRVSWSSAFGSLASGPEGNYPPNTWTLPRKAGAMSAHNLTSFAITGSGAAAGGLRTPGLSSIAITTPGCHGNLLANGIASSSIHITTPSCSIYGKAASTGDSTTTFTVTGNKNAIGWLAGSSGVVISASMNSYAIGWMYGSTGDSEAVTNASIANAVWTKMIEGSYTTSEALKICLSVLAGKTNIVGSTAKFRDVNDTTDRVTAVMTGSERTTVTLNP